MGFGGVRNFLLGLVDLLLFIGGFLYFIGFLSELKGELVKGVFEIELNDNVVVCFFVGFWGVKEDIFCRGFLGGVFFWSFFSDKVLIFVVRLVCWGFL